LIRFLLGKGAQVEVRDSEGRTPLYLSVKFEKEDAVELLLENGADACAGTTSGKSPLHEAVRTAKILKQLLAHGADPDKNADKAPSPLFDAIWSGKSEPVRLLLENGADANAKDTSGKSPLHKACNVYNLYPEEMLDTINLLLDFDADVSAADDKGRTPLHAAASAGHIVLVKLLVTHGADPNARDKYRNPPLNLAHGFVATTDELRKRKKETIEFLEQAKTRKPVPNVTERQPSERKEDHRKEGYRTWTDSTGRYRVQALFESLEDGKVVVKKEDGSTIRVPIERLSESDQEYVRSVARNGEP
jgi:ankyrin repeat protein